MKKKHLYNTLFVGSLCFATLLSATSCNPLGIEPTTKVDEEHFWQNAQLARSYVNNFYTWSVSGAGDTFQSEQCSDNCQGNYEQDWNTYRQTSFTQRQYDSETSISCFTAPWSSAYKNIRAVNLGIEKIDGNENISKELKNQLLAECYFFRAFIYFDMEKFWGTVPYVDKALSITDETYLPRENRENLFDYMLQDLNTSLDYFTAYGGTPELGMVTADAVNAFISRVALYAANAAEASAAGLYSSDDATGLFTFEKDAQHYYKIAYDAAQQVIGKYSLETNYEDLFTLETSHKSPESIWPVMFKLSNREGFNPTAINGPDGTYYGATEKASYSWGFRSGLFPTQDLVDCYLQKDEADGKWKNWWETQQAKDMGVTVVDGEISGSSADYRKMYENRDKRFYATVTYDGAYMGPEEEMYLIQTWIDNSDPKGEESYKYSALHSGYRATIKMQAPTNRSSAQTITGYYSRKYSHFDTFNDDGTLNVEQRSTCYFNIRYAEVLLNAAEAGIKLSKSDAEGYINEIRNRAGLDDFDAATAGHDLWEELKIQRRLEFAFEFPSFRYFDLLRWGEAEGKSTIDELNRPSRGIWIFRKGIESEKAGENGYPVEADDEGYFTPYFETVSMDYSYYERKFDNKRFYFVPFAGTTLSSYPQLVQNPGWTDYKYNN